MAKDINSDAMSNLLQGLTSDNEAATASSSSKKDDNVKSDKRKKPSGKVKSETISTLVDCENGKDSFYSNHRRIIYSRCDRSRHKHGY